MRIDRSIFRYIEYELYCYTHTKKEIRLCRDEIINGTHKPDVGGKAGISDPTANKSIALTSSVFLAKAERTINAIDKSLDMLRPEHNQLFDLRYIDGRPWREVYLEMNISDRTYFRLRRELVETVGLQLGLLRIDD